MNPDLEVLILALDAAQQLQGNAALEAQARFENALDHALEKHPGLSRDSLLRAVRLAHVRWCRSQQHPPTLPPQA
jgi:hypothetical protein